MRKRRLRLMLLAVTFIGVVVWLVWPTSRADIVAAKANYARLQLGMSEEEVAAVLGGLPRFKNKVHAGWDDVQGYVSTFVQGGTGTRRSERDYDWLQWDFGDSPEDGTVGHSFSVGSKFDRGRLVELWYCEKRLYAAQKFLQKVGFALDLDMPFLRPHIEWDHKAIPPP